MKEPSRKCVVIDISFRQLLYRHTTEPPSLLCECQILIEKVWGSNPSSWNTAKNVWAASLWYPNLMCAIVMNPLTALSWQGRGTKNMFLRERNCCDLSECTQQQGWMGDREQWIAEAWCENTHTWCSQAQRPFFLFTLMDSRHIFGGCLLSLSQMLCRKNCVVFL